MILQTIYIFYFSKGCVDTFAKCQQWAASGLCGKTPRFMIVHCKESCGICGFKSRELKIIDQLVKI